jgi:hypothetical protein
MLLEVCLLVKKKQFLCNKTVKFNNLYYMKYNIIMSQFYDKCCNIVKNIYEFFMFFSFRTKPELQKDKNISNTHKLDKSNSEYCELCDLDDFMLEIDLESNC